MKCSFGRLGGLRQSMRCWSCSRVGHDEQQTGNRGQGTRYTGQGRGRSSRKRIALRVISRCAVTLIHLRSSQAIWAAGKCCRGGLGMWHCLRYWSRAANSAHGSFQCLCAPFANSLGQLHAQMNASLSPEPKEIATLAAAARTSLHEQVQVSPAGSVCSLNGSPLDAGTVLRGLGAAEPTATWDDACQRLAALVAVERSLHDRGLMNATDHDDFLQRIKSLAVALRFKSSSTEWPVVFSPGGTSLPEVVRAMDILRGKLSIIAAKEATR